jgi:hypothetical protein
MGTVWRASDTLLRRDVAVKEVILPPGLAPSDRDAMYERTLREARAAAALQHPAVVQVYDVVTEGGRPWIVMELLDARSLADMVIEDGPVAPRAIAKIGIALLGALEVAHANGVLHRDVKPANVLICADGRCVLTDFGVARMPTDVQLTTPGMVLGSPHFISPERAMGNEFGPPSDLFSLGVTLYTAVEGRPPFDKGDPIETMHAVVEDPPAPTSRAGVLTEVLLGLLEKDPARRIDVETARKMLRSLLAGPLASMAPAHLATDPYAVVPSQRSTGQPPAPAQPQPTGQIGGRAMIGPGESLTDRLAELRKANRAAPGGAPWPAPGLDQTNPGALIAPTGALPEQQRWDEHGQAWGSPPGGRLVAGGTPAGRATAGARGTLTTVKRWPRKIQIAVAAGVAAVLLLGALVLFDGSDPAQPTVPQADVKTDGPSAPPFETEKYEDRGVSVNVPKGWQRKTGGLYVDFVDPEDSGRKVRVVVEPFGGDRADRWAEIAENGLKKKDSKSCARPYNQVGMTSVDLAGQTAAELEYTCGEGTDMRHGVWRGVVQNGKAYSFYLSTADTRFAESKVIFEEMIRSFQLTAAA